MMIRGKMTFLGTLALASALSFMVGTTAAIAGLKFREPPSSPVPVGHVPEGVAAADLDGDGDQDLAITNVRCHSVIILRNNGAGNFTHHIRGRVPVGDSPVAIAAADLDGDGDQDLAITNYLSNNVTILRNNGAGKFTRTNSTPLSGFPRETSSNSPALGFRMNGRDARGNRRVIDVL